MGPIYGKRIKTPAERIALANRKNASKQNRWQDITVNIFGEDRPFKVVVFQAKWPRVKYAKRTSIEPCFKDSKQVMQIDKPQHWCRESIEKLAPWVWIAQTLLSLWYLTEGRHSDEAEEARELMHGVWDTEWSIRHAMKIFRRASIRQEIASISHRKDDLREFINTLENYLYLAG